MLLLSKTLDVSNSEPLLEQRWLERGVLLTERQGQEHPLTRHETRVGRSWYNITLLAGVTLDHLLLLWNCSSNWSYYPLSLLLFYKDHYREALAEHSARWERTAEKQKQAWENLTCPSLASLLDIKQWIKMQMHSKKRDIWSEPKQQVAFPFFFPKV